MKTSLVCLVALLGLLTQGCASIFWGTHEDLSIGSTPSGALVNLSDGQTCTTPCTLRISRGTTYNVKFSKDNCVGQTEMVSSNTSGGAVAVSLIGIPAGTIIDFLDGAVYKADPNPVSSSLECKLPPIATAPAPEAPAIATLKSSASNSR
jgi:hypothetical protein